MAPVSHITTSLAPARLQTRPQAPQRSQPETAPPTGPTDPEPKAVTDTAQSDPKMDQESVKALVDQMQDAIAGTPAAPYSVAFRPRESGDGYVIEIRNEEGEIVKQFPPEKILNLRGKMDELTGMVVDKKT